MVYGEFVNKNKLIFYIFDCYGCCIDDVEFYFSYYVFMESVMQYNVYNYLWKYEGIEGVYIIRVVLMYMYYQVEFGMFCLLIMIYVVILVMWYGKQLLFVYLEKIINGVYDFCFLLVSQKYGLIIGMGMIEK